MGDNPLSFFSVEYFKKRGSWSSSTNKEESTPTVQKKRGSVPIGASGAMEEVSSDYGFMPQEVQPPPGYYEPSWGSGYTAPSNFFSESDEDVIERLAFTSRSQAGSRKAQGIIQRANPGLKDHIVNVLSREIASLMVDPYANYMCQTLFQTSTAAQRLLLLRHMFPNLIDIAQDPRGTHSLQTIISLINLPEEEALLIQAFAPYVVPLATHPNASHVIQKVILVVKNKGELIVPVSSHLMDLATNQLGLLVVKMCISNARNEEKEMLKKGLLADCVVLMQDAFGNYAIQQMLEEWSWNYCHEIMQAIAGRVVQLSLQKFASNTIERCLELAREDHRRDLLAEMANPHKIREMLDNKFGQFVLKKAMAIGGGEFKADLQKAVRSLPPGLLSQRRKGKWEVILKELD